MANPHQNIEWQDLAPPFSQQCRLRHLLRITAFNLGLSEDGKSKENSRIDTQCSPKHSATDVNTSVSDATIYYYTLHLSTMSAPFYKSEAVNSENPRWAEMEIKEILHDSASLVSKGIVIRIWKQRYDEAGDTLITAWGVYFSGLVPIPMVHSMLALPSSIHLGPNSIVFHMQGGACFTAPHCIHHSPCKFEGRDDMGEEVAKKCPKSSRDCKMFSNLKQRDEFGINSTIYKKSGLSLAESEVRSSYTLPLLQRLRTVEHAIRKQAASANALREHISASSLPLNERNLKGSSRQYDDIQRADYFMGQAHNSTAVSRSRIAGRLAISQVLTENLRLCVSILKGERGRKLSKIRMLGSRVHELATKNRERGKELKEQQECLLKEIDHLREWRNREFLVARDAFLHASAHLAFRRRQLVSELSLIYPVQQHPNGGYTICNVKLPNSEDFGPRDEIMVSVALGYVAHAVQMISIFLHAPLRYPVIHLGSRSRIMDLVADKIPDGEREFPLFSRAKDKLQFKYGVYLLNKNVAQLRWYCGLSTQDLRATLPNLSSLLYPKSGAGSIVNSGCISSIISSSCNGPTVNPDWSSPQWNDRGHHRTASSPADRVGTNYESSGSGNLQLMCRGFEKGHRVTKSVGGKEELQLIPPARRKSNNQLKVEMKDEMDAGFKGSHLSYSLDKGLDKYNVISGTYHIKTCGGRDSSCPMDRHMFNSAVDSNKSASLDHVNSDLQLGNSNVSEKLDPGDSKDMKSCTEARRQFLDGWQMSGAGAPGLSDEDPESTIILDESIQNMLTSPLILCPNLKVRTQRTNNNNVSTNTHINTPIAAESLVTIPSLITTSTAEVDRLFASVASRTEALASRSTSFNLVRSRQGSTTEDVGVS